MRVQEPKVGVQRATQALVASYGPISNWSAQQKEQLTEVVRVHDGHTVVVAQVGIQSNCGCLCMVRG